MEGNSFVNTFILNWTDLTNSPKVKKDSLNIPLQGRRAQVLDGQHRVAGLQDAFNVNPEVGEREVLVSLCIGLETRDAAKIFLNINSEQKPVPKSLIYDLFGDAVDNREHAINRANDVIRFLNENDNSPFYHRVRYPGHARVTGQVDLAIMVNAMKGHFEPEGVFTRLKLNEIEVQQKIIMNFYAAIRDTYTENVWMKTTQNPYTKGAGFNGAFEFLVETLLPRCQTDRKFSIEHMQKLMKLDTDYLITSTEIKGMEGKLARKTIKSFFNENFLKDVSAESDEYEF